MINELIALILEQVDFTDETLEALVEAQTTKTALAVEAITAFENAVKVQFPDDTPAQEGAKEIGKNIIRFANRIGATFQTLNAQQVQEFKALFKGVFAQPGDLEALGELLFDASLDGVTAIEELNGYVSGLLSAQ